MRTILIAALFALKCAIVPAIAATSFDGQWIAEIPPQAKPCNATSVLNMIVADGKIMGQVHTPWGSGSFTGQLDEQGNGEVSFGNDNGTIHFGQNRFEMNWTNGRCGHRTALGDRAPGDEQRKTMVDQRLKNQHDFDALVARAESGDKNVDYTALRHLYPFTETWEPYGNKTAAFLQQAEATQKGSDCLATLDAVASVLKYNFIIAAAHQMRADCLKSSDRARSRIEAAIADSLTRSLMASGDGGSEKTAYVVVTHREEMDVLASRHIQIKTRQTEIRGSDGHYYDLVEGISVRGGSGDYYDQSLGHAGVPVKSFYFNVDSFVAGRESRRAALTVASDSIH